MLHFPKGSSSNRPYQLPNLTGRPLPTSILGQKLCNPITCHAIRRTATTLLQDSTRWASMKRQQNTCMNHHTQPFPQAKKRNRKKTQRTSTQNGTSNLPLSNNPSISIAHLSPSPLFFFAKFQRMDSCRLCKRDSWISLRRCLE